MVRDKDRDANLNLPTEEHIFLLDDVLLDEDDQIAEPFPQDPLLNAETQHNGREGNILLVNGQVQKKIYPIRRGVPQVFGLST